MAMILSFELMNIPAEGNRLRLQHIVKQQQHHDDQEQDSGWNLCYTISRQAAGLVSAGAEVESVYPRFSNRRGVVGVCVTQPRIFHFQGRLQRARVGNSEPGEIPEPIPSTVNH
jgi:hypothetical protein